MVNLSNGDSPMPAEVQGFVVGIDGRSTCRVCGADIEWRSGPQWSGWVAPELNGHLRDVCVRGAGGTWSGHRPVVDPDALERFIRAEGLAEEMRARLADRS